MTRRSGKRSSAALLRALLVLDGGITSNLPVHLFDRPLPTRPTYAINLDGGGDPAAPAWRNIWRPFKPGVGEQPTPGAIESTPGLLSAIFDAMLNWTDNSLTRAPAQPDRICKVRLGRGEGGMHVDMPPEAIRRLAKRGTVAGGERGVDAARRRDPGGGTDGSP
jgi:hypothetical protein